MKDKTYEHVPEKTDETDTTHRNMSSAENKTGGFSPTKRRCGAAMAAVALAFAIVGMAVGALFLGDIFTGARTGFQAVDVLQTFFETPEEAIAQYFEGLNEGNMKKVYATWAIDAPAEQYNATYRRGHGYVVAWESLSLFPSEYGIYQEINRAYRLQGMAKQLAGFYTSLALADKEEYADLFEKGSHMIFEEQGQGDVDAVIKEYVDSLDPSRIGPIEVQRVDIPISDQVGKRMNIEEEFKAQATYYGGITVADRVAMIHANGQLFWCGFTTIEYEQGWQIMSLRAIYTTPPSYGVAFPTTEEEYLALLK